MSVPYVHVVRVPDNKFRTCWFRGCTSFASHVLCAGERALCFCCAQCASVAVKADRENGTFVERHRRAISTAMRGRKT